MESHLSLAPCLPQQDWLTLFEDVDDWWATALSFNRNVPWHFEPSQSALADNVIHQSSVVIFPSDQNIGVPVKGGTFSSSFILSKPWTVSCSPNQPNQSRVCFIPKPGLSNLAPLSPEVIRPCSSAEHNVPVHSCQHSVRSCVSGWVFVCANRHHHVSASHPGNLEWIPSWHWPPVGRANGGTGFCWGGSCRMRDLHANTNQMEWQADGWEGGEPESSRPLCQSP